MEMTDLDLNKLEAEAKEQLRPCNDGTPKRLHHTIIALISELREAKEDVEIQKAIALAEMKGSIELERWFRFQSACLESAEKALRFYANNSQELPTPYYSGTIARAHFQKWEEKK